MPEKRVFRLSFILLAGVSCINIDQPPPSKMLDEIDNTRTPTLVEYADSDVHLPMQDPVVVTAESKTPEPIPEKTQGNVEIVTPEIEPVLPSSGTPDPLLTAINEIETAEANDIVYPHQQILTEYFGQTVRMNYHGSLFQHHSDHCEPDGLFEQEKTFAGIDVGVPLVPDPFGHVYSPQVATARTYQVVSPEAGWVRQLGYLPKYGRDVAIIDHGKYATVHFNIRNVQVECGQILNKGDIIGSTASDYRLRFHAGDELQFGFSFE